MSSWKQQPESRQGPDTFGAPGRVSGVLVCHYHRDVLNGLRTAHGSPEGHARRVQQVAGQCLDLLHQGTGGGRMTCTKFRYRDEIAAKIALARAQRKDSPKRPKTEQRAYRCPDCRGWHLTSKEKP